MPKDLNSLLSEAEDEGGDLDFYGGRSFLFEDQEDRMTKHVIKFTNDDPEFRDYVLEILEEDDRVQYDFHEDSNRVEIFVDN